MLIREEFPAVIKNKKYLSEEEKKKSYNSGDADSGNNSNCALEEQRKAQFIKAKATKRNFIHANEGLLARLTGISEFQYTNRGWGKNYKEEVKSTCGHTAVLVPECLWLSLEFSNRINNLTAALRPEGQVVHRPHFLNRLWTLF